MLTIKSLSVKNFMSVGNTAQGINFDNKRNGDLAFFQNENNKIINQYT